MYQKIIIVGRLGKDPDQRFTPTGHAVTTFNVATDRQYKGQQGEAVKETVWFKVTAWGKLAETCNTYLQKGKQVLIEGRLTVDPKTNEPHTWMGSDGNPHASYEVTAETVKFMGGGSKESEPQDAPDQEYPF
jgi:single-strand DNA-binding protein